MKTTGANPSEIKLELFRFIDNLSDNRLRDFYNFFIANRSLTYNKQLSKN